MPRRAVSLMFAITMLGSTLAIAAAASCGDPPAMTPLSFGTPVIVDQHRAGGEPDVQALPDGSLIYLAHGGTTHLYKPNEPNTDWPTTYDGSETLFRSEDNGATWQYIGLNGTASGPHAGPGFSDPTIAVDSAGAAYISGTTYPSNVYVAASDDSGKTWRNNPAVGWGTDREWLAADTPGLVYLLASEPKGRVIITSKDGGRTWNWGTGMPVAGVNSPIAVDQRNGRLYHPVTDSLNRQDYPQPIQVFTDLRDGGTTSFLSMVNTGLPSAHGFINPLTVDAAGTVYVLANTDREIRMVYSTNGGVSWKTSLVYRSAGPGLLWPWISAGADGRVAVSWLQSDSASAYQVQGSFRVYSAETITGHGWVDTCGIARGPAWQTSVATLDPMHTGQICESGLNCNLDNSPAGDRRLGDYITSTITPEGKLVIAYGNTANDPTAAISHPAVVTQTGGADFFP